jgi:membrane protein DedA with SNARE-associated domain
MEPAFGPDAAEIIGLFAAPFLHESVAFVGGAYLIQQGALSPLSCTLALLAGVIASDLAIFGLGRLARRHPRLAARLPAGPAFDGALDRHLFWLIPFCRFVPGLLFAVFAGCGMLGTDFRRFALICVTTATIYTPLFLYGVLKLGDAVSARDSLALWAAILAGLFLSMSAIRWVAGQLLERRTPWRHSAKG